MQVPQNIIDKAQKALNLKEGAEAVGNVNEAAAAAKILHDILMKWSLDIETVKASKVAQKANIEEVKFETPSDKRETNWITKLYQAVAENSMCKILYTMEHEIRIVGHTESVAFVAYACEQLVAKIRIAEKLCWNAYTGEEKRGTYRRGFFNGAVAGIWSKLQEAMYAASQNAFDNPYAVMVNKHESELKEWMYENGYMRRPPTEEQLKKMQEDRQKRSDEWAEKWNKMTDKEKKEHEKAMNKLMKGGRKQRERKGPRGITSRDGLQQGVITGRAININKAVDNSASKGHIN